MNENPTNVPVKLNDNDNNTTRHNTSIKNIPVCQLKTNKMKSFSIMNLTNISFMLSWQRWENMLVNFSKVSNIFIVCGSTDVRKGIDGLASIIVDNYNLNLFDDALFLFCGRRKDRFKELYFDKDGFILLVQTTRERITTMAT